MGTIEEQIIKEVKDDESLPTIPAVALDVLRLARDPRNSIERMAEAMERDPALTIKTLRFANSAYYGAAKPMVSLPQAIIRIGIRGAKMLALSFSLADTLARGQQDFNFPAFWQRSLTTAAVARRLAAYSLRSMSEEIFVTALLSDMGCLILNRRFPKEYKMLQYKYAVTSASLVELEQKLLGTDHARIGCKLAELWRLPAPIGPAIGAHHDPSPLRPEDSAFNVAMVVMVASDLAEILIRGATEQRVNHLAEIFHTQFSFNTEHLNVLLHLIGPEIQDISRLLEVPLPPVDQVQEQAKADLARLALLQAADGQAPGRGSAPQEQVAGVGKSPGTNEEGPKT
jgi:HD-like signal output (HDOD) protein